MGEGRDLNASHLDLAFDSSFLNFCSFDWMERLFIGTVMLVTHFWLRLCFYLFPFFLSLFLETFSSLANECAWWGPFTYFQVPHWLTPELSLIHTGLTSGPKKIDGKSSLQLSILGKSHYTSQSNFGGGKASRKWGVSCEKIDGQVKKKTTNHVLVIR